MTGKRPLGMGSIAARLPPTVLAAIFSYLDLKDLMNCCLTCKLWSRYLRDENNEVWKMQCQSVLSDEALKTDVLVGCHSYKSKLRAFYHSWNPHDCSRNVYIKANGFTVHRNPVAQSTDGARGKRGFKKGRHCWEVWWEFCLPFEMTPSVMGVTSYPSDDVSAADFSPDEDAEESRFYKGRYFSLRLKCQMIQQKNERALRRLSIVRKLVRRLNRQNKCLTLRLKKHDSRWRETKVVATWEAPDARLSDFSNAVLGSTLPESLVPAPHATGKTGLKFADFKTSHQIQTVTNSNNDKDSQILGSSNSILKTSNFPS